MLKRDRAKDMRRQSKHDVASVKAHQEAMGALRPKGMISSDTEFEKGGQTVKLIKDYTTGGKFKGHIAPGRGHVKRTDLKLSNSESAFGGTQGIGGPKRENYAD
jgi:hypothetical protein